MPPLRREQVEAWIQAAVSGRRELDAWLAQPGANQHPAFAVLSRVTQGTTEGLRLLQKVAAGIEKEELQAQAAVIAGKIATLNGVLNG